MRAHRCGLLFDIYEDSTSNSSYPLIIALMLVFHRVPVVM